MRSAEILGVLLCAAGCRGYFDGELVVEEVRVTELGDDKREIEIEVANVGRTAVWAHGWPHRLALDTEANELIVGLHTGEPGEPVAGYLEPLVSYERVATRSNLFKGNRATLSVVVSSNSLFPYADTQSIVVEVGWHQGDPGQQQFEGGAAPDDVAIGEWPP